MDWIHCNVCFGQPVITSRKLKFYLLSCGHIFCDTCGSYSDDSSEKCKICQQSCSSVKLDGEKNSEVLKYFDEPENILNHLMQVIKFQKGHQAKLLRHQRYILQKHGRVKEYVKKLEDELKTVNHKMMLVLCNKESPTAFESNKNVQSSKLVTPINSKPIEQNIKLRRKLIKARLSPSNTISDTNDTFSPKTPAFTGSELDEN